ncbi:MAG: potassium transporter ATPase, partial [Deinococcus sp.]|nr:potassium transporter ATPase [Deinococcus sp.]
LIPQLGMFLNDVYGGIGVGLINMLVFVILTVFIAGLMVGRSANSSPPIPKMACWDWGNRA